MSDSEQRPRLGRRQFFKYAGGAAAAAAGAGAIVNWRGPVLHPLAVEKAYAAGPVAAPDPTANVFIGGTDGWITLPSEPHIGQFHPDPYAPSPYTTYIFGFRNITDVYKTPVNGPAMAAQQKNHAQATAPMFWVRETPAGQTTTFKVSITNLGLAQRPDLFDAHTLHWHGFRNVIPFFDGEPTGSVSVPAGSVFTYAYRPRDPGTYMYHCHVEDVEHVHMGMTGMVFVRPKQDGTSISYGGSTFKKFAYNDGDGSTGFHREYAMMLTEVWAESHWADAHIQLPEWSDYKADFSLINGRVYPDTVAPGAPLDQALVTAKGPSYDWPYIPATTDASGDLVADPSSPHLNRQPLSSLVKCNAGESVLLRFANLGFKEAAMTTAGISFRVIGRDATPMQGRGGADTEYTTNTLSLGAGESGDVIFTAPAHSGGSGYDTYLLYNRNYSKHDNKAAGSYGGQTTEIRVYPAGTLPAQSFPNY